MPSSLLKQYLDEGVCKKLHTDAGELIIGRHAPESHEIKKITSYGPHIVAVRTGNKDGDATMTHMLRKRDDKWELIRKAGNGKIVRES